MAAKRKVRELRLYYAKRFARCRIIGTHDMAAEYGFLLALPPYMLFFLRGGNL